MVEIYFENTNPPHNKFYRMCIEETLFRNVVLRRHWGRIGKKGRIKVDFFDTQGEAERKLRALYRKRMRHGYRVMECRGIPRIPKEASSISLRPGLDITPVCGP